MKTASGTSYVALFRGINVGKAKRVAMADLRALLERLGYRDVRTLLNSGNAVFRAVRTSPEKAAARIGAAVERELGVSARVTVLTGADLETAAAENPLVETATNPSRLLVAFLNDPADRAKVLPLARRDWAPEALAVGSRAVYLWCPDGVLKSAAARALERTLGEGVTSRNRTTVEKLRALVAAGGQVLPARGGKG